MTTFLDKAHEDIVAIESMSDHMEANAAVICYHAQQSIEKQLKYVMETELSDSYGGENAPPYTHDLILLMSRLEADGILSPSDAEKDDAAELTTFEAGTRYPMEREYSEADAVAAIEGHNRLAGFLAASGLEALKIDLVGKSNLLAVIPEQP